MGRESSRPEDTVEETLREVNKLRYSSATYIRDFVGYSSVYGVICVDYDL